MSLTAAYFMWKATREDWQRKAMNRQERNEWLHMGPRDKYRIRLHDDFEGSSTRWTLEDFNPVTNVVTYTYDYFPTWGEAYKYYLKQVS
jgi:hypothetical protein